MGMDDMDKEYFERISKTISMFCGGEVAPKEYIQKAFFDKDSQRDDLEIWVTANKQMPWILTKDLLDEVLTIAYIPEYEGDQLPVVLSDEEHDIIWQMARLTSLTMLLALMGPAQMTNGEQHRITRLIGNILEDKFNKYIDDEGNIWKNLQKDLNRLI